MKKKLVTALVLASMISGVSAVYADYRQTPEKLKG